MVDFSKSSWFVAVNAFGFENRKEIFCHGIIIKLSFLCHRWCNAVLFSQMKICVKGILKAFITVEVQLCNGPFSFSSLLDEWCSNFLMGLAT